MSHSKLSRTSYSNSSSYSFEFPWVKEDPMLKHSALCTRCKTSINITSMGKTALKSHEKSAKHSAQLKDKNKCLKIEMLFKSSADTGKQKEGNVLTKPQPGTSTSQGSEVAKKTPMPSIDEGQATQTAPPALKHFLLAESVTKSKIFWCLEIVVNHIPFRTAARCASNFHLQFPDSTIASKLQLQRTKVGYVVFGLAPYFQHQLEKIVKDASHIVLCFDEALNKVSQRLQMDLHVRFWDLSKNQISTRYFSSVFLGHSAASDLLKGITASFSKEVLNKVVQVSMDGPNVNFKLLSNLQIELQDTPESPIFLNIGSCGLHTVHGAFKSGMQQTGWDIVKYSRALYYLFKDSPARRSDYVNCTGSNVFPQKFCAVRWVESGSVAARALVMLPNVKKYVESAVNAKKEPTSASFSIVKTHLKDKMLGPKLEFFSSMASLMEPFLKEFQSDAPMAPFLYGELTSLVQTLMERVVKRDVLDAEKGRLDRVDIWKTENLLTAKHVDIGFATRDAIRTCGDTSDRDKLELRQRCRTALLFMIKKIMERSPLKHKLTKSISCFNPSIVSHDLQLAESRLNSCLEEVVAKRWISGSAADSIKRQYHKLFVLPETINECKKYKRTQTRLDSFFMDLISLSSSSDTSQLSNFITLILTLSHGNASVERGFSINNECILIENLKEESLVALRQVYDGVRAAGGLEGVVLTKEMVHAARNAHARYTEHLKRNEKEIGDKERIDKERKRAAKKKKELETKKAKLMADAMKEVAILDKKICVLKKKIE